MTDVVVRARSHHRIARRVQGRGYKKQTNTMLQVLPTQKNLKVDVEKGMSDGQQIVFKGESE